MKFDLTDYKTALYQVVVENDKLCTQLADTPLWKNEGVFEATLIINGVTVPAEHIENTLQNLYTQCEEYYKRKYDVSSFDERVEERAKELLREHASDALVKIGTLTEILEDSTKLLQPCWERNSK